MRTKKLLYVSLLIAFSLILSYIETFIPAIPIPGAKLGLASIATLLALYLFDFKTSFTVVALRIILSAFMFTNFTALIYSLSGGIVSLIAMYLTIKLAKDKLSIIGVSIIGAVFHNMAQLAAAIFVLGTVSIVTLTPWLLFLGIITGIFTGLASKYVLKYSHIKKQSDNFYNK
ncbi:MAG: Gx transporter family protein [Eubacteriaceae bacterium]